MGNQSVLKLFILLALTAACGAEPKANDVKAEYSSERTMGAWQGGIEVVSNSRQKEKLHQVLGMSTGGLVAFTLAPLWGTAAGSYDYYHSLDFIGHLKLMKNAEDAAVNFAIAQDPVLTDGLELAFADLVQHPQNKVSFQNLQDGYRETHGQAMTARQLTQYKAKIVVALAQQQ